MNNGASVATTPKVPHAQPDVVHPPSRVHPACLTGMTARFAARHAVDAAK